MAIVKEIDGSPFWLDPQGRLVPQAQVKPEDQARDELIEGLVAGWKKCQKEMKSLKQWVYSEVAAFFELLHQEYQAKPRPQGGVTLKDFSGRYKLIINVSDQICFDERLNVAKSLIDSCIERWSRDSEPNLVTIIKDAFRVNQQGRVSIPRVLGLRNLGIEDEEWQRAMQAITDSVVVEHTKRYVRLYERDPEHEDQFVALSLDIASL